MDLESFLTAAYDLLALESTAERPAELHRALNFVLEFVGPGFSLERFESAGKPSALVYPAGERPKFDIILNAHLDVVPAPIKQFKPYRNGDCLYARGAQDMKVSALVQALVFRELAAMLPYRLGLQLVTDEEAGGRNGTLHQLLCGVSSGFVLIGETSELQIVTESKGVIRVALHAAGHSAHSAYPWLGDNALLKLYRTMEAILQVYPLPREEVWRTTVSPVEVATLNPAINQIPASAKAWLDFRFPAGDARLDGQDAEHIATYLARFCEPGVIPVVERMEPPHRADEHSIEIRRLQAASRAQGFSGDFVRKHGTEDSRYYTMFGINSVSFGTGGQGQHGPDEYVNISTIEPYYRALSNFILDPGIDRAVSSHGV
jgi:succinyl-diaminopimelate desuccinylase